MAEILSNEQIEAYREMGYLVLERHLPDDILIKIRAEISRFEDEARGMTESNERLDLEDSHTIEDPRLRRRVRLWALIGRFRRTQKTCQKMFP